MYKLCDSNIKSTLRMVSVLTNVSVPKKKKKKFKSTHRFRK